MAAGLAPWPPSGGRLTGRPVSGARTDPRETGCGLASVDASGSGAGSGRLSSQAGYPSEDGTSATVEPEAGCGSEGTTAGTSNRRSPALAQSSRGRAPAAAVTPCPNTVHTDSETACQRVEAGREMAIPAVRSASWEKCGPMPQPLRGTPLPCRKRPLPGTHPMPNVQTLGLANGSVRCVVTPQPIGTSGEEKLRRTPANGQPCLGPVVELISSADRNAMRN